MMFAAFGAYLMKVFTLRRMVSVFLTFVTLNQLELEGVFLHVKSLMVYIYSIFDAFAGCFKFEGKDYEGEMMTVVLELSSQ